MDAKLGRVTGVSPHPIWITPLSIAINGIVLTNGGIALPLSILKS